MTRYEWVLYFVVVPLLVSVLILQLVGCADKYPTKVDYVLTWPAVPIADNGMPIYNVTYNVYEWPSLFRVATTNRNSLAVRTPGCWFITASAQRGAEGPPNPVTCVP